MHILRRIVVALFLIGSCKSMPLAAEASAQPQGSTPWYSDLAASWQLPDVSASPGTMRHYDADRRTGKVIVTDLTVLPDGGTARVTVMVGKRREQAYVAKSRDEYEIPRAEFESLKSLVLDALLPRQELLAPSPVAAGSTWVCADGPLQTAEVRLGHPAPLYVKREADCSFPDPVVDVGALMRAFVKEIDARRARS